MFLVDESTIVIMTIGKVDVCTREGNHLYE